MTRWYGVMDLQLGLDTFGDIALDRDGQPLPAATVVREVLAEGQLADSLGIDVFGVGEHHRPDYAVSAPDTLLAGLATTTERIRLGTSVTVLSSDDPIRVFERFSTVDALSHGRAEITVGRGSFVESFPLFGLDLQDYEVLFSDKLDLLAHVEESRENEVDPDLLVLDDAARDPGGGGNAVHRHQSKASRRQQTGQLAVAAADFQRLAERAGADRRQGRPVFGRLIGTGAVVPGILACGVKPGQMGKGVAMGQ